jgi:UDP-N-acetylmuramate dehydrogenase
MKIRQNQSISKFVTIKLGGPASFVVTVTKKEEIPKALGVAKKSKLPWFVSGGGSNTIGRDTFKGVLILNRIGGIARLGGRKWRIGTGVELDKAVAKTVKANHSGMECLSGIPGNVGGAPVHNAGAYGQEFSSVITSVEAYDVQNHKFVNLNRKDCQFSYLNSVFKQSPSRYIITSVVVELEEPDSEMPIKHSGLQNYLEQHKISKVSPKILRKAVLRLRDERLPSLKKYASAGSFFRNPVLETKASQTFRRQFPDAPFEELPDGQTKVFAGWLIEQAGLKGVKKYGFTTYSKNALIVINESATSFAALEKFTKFLQTKVYQKFRVKLERDPDLIK